MMPPQTRERRPRRWKEWGVIACWSVLGLVPFSILVLVSVLMVRTPRAKPVAYVAVLGVALLTVACMVIIVDKALTSIYRSRAGRLCVRCGYDLQGDAAARCPECGLEGAVRAPYRSAWDRIPPTLRGAFLLLTTAVGLYVLAVVALGMGR